MQARGSRKTILVVTFSYCYTLTPNRPEKESPFFRLIKFLPALQHWTIALAPWYSFNRHMFLYDGIRHTSASDMSHFSPHPTHGPSKTCKHRRNKLPAPPTLTSSRLGIHAMYIFLGVCTVIMQHYSRTQIRKDLTIAVFPISCVLDHV